jgi:N-acetylglucosamine-6-phosphate deacetylase
MLAFTAGRLLGPTDVIEHPLLLIERGRIVEISRRIGREIASGISVCDFGDHIIAPGYVDLHIHGSAGHDVMDDSVAGLRTMERFLAQHGVTGYFATTVTASIDITLRALERLAASIAQREQDHADSKGRARQLGIHLEGPFISHTRRGVHPTENLLSPTLKLFEQFWQASSGRIRMMTIAPELDGAIEVITEAARRGVCVSVGHSDADFETTERAITAGASHATHTFNAMRALDHRHPGILGAVLTDRRVTADIIADGVHLDPAIVKLVASSKGPQQTVLITDAISATGMPDGHYHLGPLEVDVRDGACTKDGKLAGSVLTMDRAVRNLAIFAEWDLAHAVNAASQNAARAAQIAKKGVLEVGADADFLVLNAQGEVLRTFIGGEECSG